MLVLQSQAFRLDDADHPVHMLLANHHKPPEPGTNFWFRAPDGTVHVRSIQVTVRVTVRGL